jgi:hypothetical protein
MGRVRIPAAPVVLRFDAAAMAADDELLMEDSVGVGPEFQIEMSENDDNIERVYELSITYVASWLCRAITPMN